MNGADYLSEDKTHIAAVSTILPILFIEAEHNLPNQRLFELIF